MAIDRILRSRGSPRACAAAAILLAFVLATVSPQAQTAAPSRPVFRSGTELVLVNVVVRDKSGAVVRGLTKNDFTVLEDGKPQTIDSFDFEELDKPGAEPASPEPADTGIIRLPAPRAAAAPPTPPPAAPAKIDMRGRRLIVMFFDLSSMQPEEIERAAKSAHEYVDKSLSPADLVAVASFSSSLKVDQDFTADRDELSAALDQFGTAAGQGFQEGTAGSAEDTADTGGAFTVDDTEFNIFQTDLRLQALQQLADALSGIEQKKSVIYFSSGMDQSSSPMQGAGNENQVQLRRMVDHMVRANVSIYAADMRGLQALPPGGEAQNASLRGTSPFSGASVSNRFNSLATTQDSLTTMSEDTGGRAFFDSNAFGDVFKRVVADTSAYYVLGFSTANPARDGKFRRISVRVNRPDMKDAKLEYRSGYYAPRDFAHSTKDDREQQLQDQLTSELSATDLTGTVATAYFRVAENRYFVPVSVLMPGYQVPFTRATDKSKATIDVLGIVRDRQNRPFGRIRDTVRIAPDSTDDLKTKTVQYESGFELAPGKYHLKVVVRENLDGTMGSYETDVVVPDLKGQGVRISSVVLGTQLQAGARKDDRNPLVHDGRELIPNVTRVVSTGQHLYFYYEVYDPAHPQAPGGQRAGDSGIKLMTSIAFYRGRVRVFETPLVEATELTSADRKTAVFQLDVPAAAFKPGTYVCQVNIVDDVAGTFAFPRMQLYVRR